MVSRVLSIGLQISIIVAIGMLTTSAIAHGSNECQEASEFAPYRCPLHLPAISKIMVKEHHRPDTEAQAEECSSYRVSETQARRFLERAWTVSRDDSLHRLDWSPCSAVGSVEFVDGRQGDWYISALGRGTLTISGAPPVYLYCPDC